MPITWRNVDAPDFGPSLQGYRTFSELLGNAFGGLQAGLNRYDRSISDRVNNAIQLRIAGAQDAKAAKAIASGLTADPNAARISAATIAAATARPGDLISQAINEEALGWTGYQHGRTRGFDQARDQAAPLAAQQLAAYAAGKGSEWDAANPGFGQGLSLEDRRNLFSGTQEAERNAVTTEGARIGNAGSIIRNKAAQFDYDVSKLTFDEDRAVKAALADAVGRGYDGSNVDEAVVQYNLSGPAQLAFRQALGGSISGGSGFGGGGSGGEGGSLSVPNDGQRVMGYTPRASIGGDNSDAAVDTKLKLVSGQAGVGIDAPLTREQFLSLDMAQGEGRPAAKNNVGNMRNLDGSFREFDSVAQARSAITSWLDRRWKEGARTVRDAVEGRVVNGPSPQALLTNAVVGKAGSADQRGQLNANSIAQPIQAALASNKSQLDVVRELTGENGPLKGANADWVTRQINSIKASAKNAKDVVDLNDEAAGIILARSSSVGQTGFFAKPWWSRDNLGGGYEVNPKNVKSYLDQLTTGTYQSTLATDANIQLRSSQADAAKSRWDAAYQRLVQVEARAAGNPRFDQAILDRARETEARAGLAYQSALDAQTGGAIAGGGIRGLSEAPPVVTAPPVAVRARPSVTSADRVIAANLLREATGAVRPRNTTIWGN